MSSEIELQMESARQDCLDRIVGLRGALDSIEHRVKARNYSPFSPCGHLASLFGPLDCRLATLVVLAGMRDNTTEEAERGK